MIVSVCFAASLRPVVWLFFHAERNANGKKGALRPMCHHQTVLAASVPGKNSRMNMSER